MRGADYKMYSLWGARNDSENYSSHLKDNRERGKEGLEAIQQQFARPE
jgi:hypothetical protein